MASTRAAITVPTPPCQELRSDGFLRGSCCCRWVSHRPPEAVSAIASLVRYQICTLHHTAQNQRRGHWAQLENICQTNTTVEAELSVQWLALCCCCYCCRWSHRRKEWPKDQEVSVTAVMSLGSDPGREISLLVSNKTLILHQSSRTIFGLFVIMMKRVTCRCCAGC